MPLYNMNVLAPGKEWRLMYRTNEGMEYHNHLKVKKSTVKTAGYGLFLTGPFVIMISFLCILVTT